MIEAMQHPENVFVTLTYNDNHLPLLPDGLGTVVPRHLQLFLKRLRKQIPTPIRFFAVGEYGNETWRPHYHLALFNFSNCARGTTLTRGRSARRIASSCCSQCALVERLWGQGDIELRSLDPGKSGYLAGYVTKKMTKKEDARLAGRHPEFSRMSNRPGIGAPGVAQMAEVLKQFAPLSDLIDVPTHLLHEKKQLVLGRYLRRKLRKALGVKEETPNEILQEVFIKTMLPVHLYTKNNSDGVISLKEAFALLNAPYAESLASKMRIFEKGKI